MTRPRPVDAIRPVGDVWRDRRRHRSVQHMSAGSASRTAWWRRWAGPPVAVALFFATSVVAGPPSAAPASGPVRVPAVLRVVAGPAPQATGQWPDLPLADHGGPGRTAPHLTAYAWLPERAGARAVAWWTPRRPGDGHRAQAGRRAHPVRGPPGRRAADASS